MYVGVQHWCAPQLLMEIRGQLSAVVALLSLLGILPTCKRVSGTQELQIIMSCDVGAGD